MNQNPMDEANHWGAIDLDNPVDLHGDPPYRLVPVTDRLTSALEPSVPERVLDMGCGIGRLTNLLARAFGSDTMVIGFDISVNAVYEAVRAQPANAWYWHSDGRTIPSGITGTFDLIYSVTMFQHIPHDAKWSYIVQAAERIRPDGAFVFTVAVGDEPPTFLNHQLTEQELEDFASAMTNLFSTVSVDGPDSNGWTWVEARA